MRLGGHDSWSVEGIRRVESLWVSGSMRVFIHLQRSAAVRQHHNSIDAVRRWLPKLACATPVIDRTLWAFPLVISVIWQRPVAGYTAVEAAGWGPVHYCFVGGVLICGPPSFCNLRLCMGAKPTMICVVGRMSHSATTSAFLAGSVPLCVGACVDASGRRRE